MFPFSDPQTLGGLQGLVDVAGYIARLSPNPKPIPSSTENSEVSIAKGKVAFKQHCTTCHGEGANGNGEKFYPMLKHQHFPYLVRELQWIRDKVRKNGDPVMVHILQEYSDEDINNVAAYLAQLK